MTKLRPGLSARVVVNPPLRAKRKARVQWGVWIPCKDHCEARDALLGVTGIPPTDFPLAKIRRLPLKPKGGK